MSASRDAKNFTPQEFTGMDSTCDGPRRAVLAQARARRTRESLVSAALQLWSERGFAHGIESTTVEEITRAAGVSRNTFYFHFAHKQDVLLEMSLTTSDAMNDVAQRAAAEGDTIDDIMVKSFDELARRTEHLPRAAVARMLREFYEFPTRAREPSVLHGSFRKHFAEASHAVSSRAASTPTISATCSTR
jgi:AcrR family transcriptional regulator